MNWQEHAKQAADRGRLIEAGWIELAATIMPPGAPKVQVAEMKKAFFAGAASVFHSIMTILEPGAEPTEADLKRVGLIEEEIRLYFASLLAEDN